MLTMVYGVKHLATETWLEYHKRAPRCARGQITDATRSTDSALGGGVWSLWSSSRRQGAYSPVASVPLKLAVL
eukprot:2073832-Amphidinium_carterae.1